MPQLEAGPLNDAGRRALRRRRRIDQREILGDEGIGLREGEGAVRGRVAPARHGPRRDRAQPVRRAVERRGGVGGGALRHHRHQHAVRGERGEKPPFDRGVEGVEPVGGGQDLAGRIHVQGAGEGDRVGAGAALFLEAEADPRHAGELVVMARIDPLLADQGEVREDQGDDVVGVPDSRFGRLDPDAERREVRVLDAHPRAQRPRPAARLQRREQAAAAFVSEEMRGERERLRPVVRAQRRDREREQDRAALADRLDVESRRQGPFPVERHGDAPALDVAARHRREPHPRPVFQHVQRLAAEDRELHQVRGVVVLVEADQLVAEVGAGAVRERLRVPDGKARERVAGVEGLPPRGRVPALVAAAPGDVFRVHDLALALDVLAVEPGRYEEPGEAVERAVEMGGVDLEEIDGVVERGRGVAGAAVLVDEAMVLAGVRVLVGAEKQHVLKEVREARAIVRVAGAPHVDVERRRCLVGVRVGDEERFEPVVEGDRAVVAGVGGAAFDLLGAHRRGGEQRDARRREEAAPAEPWGGVDFQASIQATPGRACRRTSG